MVCNQSILMIHKSAIKNITIVEGISMMIIKPILSFSSKISAKVAARVTGGKGFTVKKTHKEKQCVTAEYTLLDIF